MRYSVAFARAYAATIPLGVACAALTACDRLKATGESDTMSLLRSGSEKICVASDVHEVLRKLILPADSGIGGDIAGNQHQKALASVSLSYELTTLQAFDKAVSKATCATTLQISGPGGKTSKFPATYQISPSAEQPSGFVVTTDAADASAFASLLVQATATKLKEDQEQAEQQAATQQAHATLMGIVSERWLAGTWIGSSEPSSSCSSLEGVRFEDGHMLEGAFGVGRWSLTGDQLHVLGEHEGRSIDVTAVITAADSVSFTMQVGQDQPLSLRRCTVEESQATDASPKDGGAAEQPRGY